LKTANNMILWN